MIWVSHRSNAHRPKRDKATCVHGCKKWRHARTHQLSRVFQPSHQVTRRLSKQGQRSRTEPISSQANAWESRGNISSPTAAGTRPRTYPHSQCTVSIKQFPNQRNQTTPVPYSTIIGLYCQGMVGVSHLQPNAVQPRTLEPTFSQQHWLSKSCAKPKACCNAPHSRDCRVRHGIYQGKYAS